MKVHEEALNMIRDAWGRNPAPSKAELILEYTNVSNKLTEACRDIHHTDGHTLDIWLEMKRIYAEWIADNEAQEAGYTTDAKGYFTKK